MPDLRPRQVLADGLTRADVLDHAVARRLRATDRAALDRAMRQLSTSADHSRLWVAVAGLLCMSGHRNLIRGAVAGLVSGALSSLVVNQGLKRALPRHRPSSEDLLRRRRLRRAPTSSSFPSGHSASATAFATGVALQAPATGLVLGPLAAAVAYSRLHTGVHFISDVLAGGATGIGVAVLVRRTLERAVGAASVRR